MWLLFGVIQFIHLYPLVASKHLKKNLLGSYECLDKLEGKIRKCLFFMLKYSKITLCTINISFLAHEQNHFSPFRFWWLPEETNTGAKWKEFLVQRLLGGFIWLWCGSKILWNQVRQSWNSLPTATAKALQP